MMVALLVLSTLATAAPGGSVAVGVGIHGMRVQSDYRDSGGGTYHRNVLVADLRLHPTPGFRVEWRARASNGAAEPKPVLESDLGASGCAPLGQDWETCWGVRSIAPKLAQMDSWWEELPYVYLVGGGGGIEKRFGRGGLRVDFAMATGSSIVAVQPRGELDLLLVPKAGLGVRVSTSWALLFQGVRMERRPEALLLLVVHVGN